MSNNVNIRKLEIYKINSNYGSYEVFKSNILGSGTYATVYLGRCINSSKIKQEELGKDKLVSIKKINMNRLSNSGTRMILTEKEILEKIMNFNNKNIVKCYDIIDDIDAIYIIMEYCNGGDLSSLLINLPIKDIFIKHYFIQIINAIKFLHEKNIIHRDIKPKNMLLTNNKIILKLCDFGFAKQHDGLKRINTICGSPMYMAPEIYKKDGYTPSVDVWSLGIILYEMVFGKHPLSKYNDIDSISDFLTTQDIIIPENDSILCTDLLKKMLNKNENERISLENLFIHPWIMSCSIITDEKLFDQDIYLDIEENLEIVDKKRKNSFIFDM